MTILYMVATYDKDTKDYYVYLRTLDKDKAELLRERIAEHWPDIEINTFALDEPIYFLDIKIGDVTTYNNIMVGNPEDDEDLKNKHITILRKERIV